MIQRVILSPSAFWILDCPGTLSDAVVCYHHLSQAEEGRLCVDTIAPAACSAVCNLYCRPDLPRDRRGGGRAAGGARGRGACAARADLLRADGVQCWLPRRSAGRGGAYDRGATRPGPCSAALRLVRRNDPPPLP